MTANGGIRILGLFKNIPRVSYEAQLKLEEADMHPRVTTFVTEMNIDVLDQSMLAQAPMLFRSLYALLPVFIAQVIEAFRIKRRYSVVLSWGEILAFPFALLCKLTRTTSVKHIAMCTWPSKGVKGLLLRFVHSRINRLVLWSSVQRQILERDYGIPSGKISFIKYFVDQKFFRPLQQTSDMICSVGSEMRDYPTLVEALRGLDIKCHVAGGTLDLSRSKWVKAVEDVHDLPRNITVGKKSALELRDLYARSRFLVIPLHESNTDNGISCILEAMAMGKPVICTRTTGQVDVIVEGKTGLLVPPADSKALRSAITSLWDKPEEVERMGREARKYVEECQTLDKFVADIKEIVGEVAVGRTRERLSPGNEEDFQSVSSLTHVPVMMYHRVCRKGEGVNSPFVVHADVFERQLESFVKHGFYTPNLKEILSNPDALLRKTKRPLILTFDDGYVDTLDIAAPLLRKYNLTAIAFVLTDFTRGSNWWDQGSDLYKAKLMNEQEIRRLEELGIEIGSHGYSHRPLPTLDDEELSKEFSHSKKVVENLLGHPVDHFAYPYGFVDERVKLAARNAGYTCAFAVDSGPWSFHKDPFQIRRTLIANRTDRLYLLSKLYGIEKSVRTGWSTVQKVVGRKSHNGYKA